MLLKNDPVSFVKEPLKYHLVQVICNYQGSRLILLLVIIVLDRLGLPAILNSGIVTIAMEFLSCVNRGSAREVGLEP